MSESNSSSQAATHHSIYERCDAAYLRELHAASGMDETQLARIACLSLAQVRQLAEGGDSLFYSHAVKRQAYKRLLLILGAPPPSQVETVVDPSTADLPPPRQTIDDIVALSERNQYLEHRPLVDFIHDLRLRVIQWRQPLAALVLLLLAFTLLLANWPSKDATNQATAPNASVAPAAALAPVAVPPVVNNSAPPAVPEPVHEEKPTDKANDKSAAALSTETKGCAYRTDKLPEVMPTVASKEGRYVYLVSPSDVVVCVVDANRQATSLSLRAGEGRSVYGPAPWQVMGQDLSKVQIFFQGWRVALPEGAAQGVTLTEKTN